MRSLPGTSKAALYRAVAREKQASAALADSAAEARCRPRCRPVAGSKLATKSRRTQNQVIDKLREDKELRDNYAAAFNEACHRRRSELADERWQAGCAEFRPTGCAKIAAEMNKKYEDAGKVTIS
eukprot:COSAG05_NODE_8651_length_683_cov_3.707192_1_plen_125_part_00